MEFQEYVQTYLDMINEVLKRTFSDYDENASVSMLLMTSEQKIAEQDWFNFVNDNKQKPDRAHLMENVHRFGVNRADLFDKNTREISKEDFIQFYIDGIKKHDLIIKSKFESDDLQFILDRERHIVEKKFDEGCNHQNGYEELNIRSSKKTQEWLLKAMVLRFERDFESFYFGLQTR